MVSVFENDLWWFLLTSVRYSLNRCSYAPSLAAELVIRYRTHLDPEQVAQIRDEVRKELEAAERHGNYVGHECDHKTWRRLVDELAG